jgi:hypothetical protein
MTQKFRELGDLAYEVEHVSRWISRKLQPMLKGRPPNVQSAVLADLLSIWLAGHWPPQAREELLADFVKLVRDIVPETEKQLFGPGGHPAGREYARLVSTIASAKAKIAAAKNGDPEGEDVALTLAELIVIEDGLELLRKVIPKKTNP